MMHRPSQRRSPDFVPASVHDWFTALNNRQIAAGDRIWVTEVAGVHTNGADWWIQMTPLTEDDYGLVFHLRRQTSVWKALAALHGYASGEAKPLRVVDISRPS